MLEDRSHDMMARRGVRIRVSWYNLHFGNHCGIGAAISTPMCKNSIVGHTERSWYKTGIDEKGGGYGGKKRQEDKMDGKGKCSRLHEDTDPGVEWQERAEFAGLL